MKVNKQKLNCSIQISSISDYWGGDIFLPPNEIYSLLIDYPLRNPATFNIKTGKKGMGSIDLICKIGKLYNKIYDSELNENGKYGIWGHSIEDLCLAEIKIDHNKKKITIGVDS